MTDAQLRQQVRKLAVVQSGGFVGRPFYTFQSFAWETWHAYAKSHPEVLPLWTIATELRVMQQEMDADRSRHTNKEVKPAAPMRYFDTPTPPREEMLKPEATLTE